MNLPMSLSSEKCKTLRQSWITSKYSWGKVKLLPLLLIFQMFVVSVEGCVNTVCTLCDTDKHTFAYIKTSSQDLAANTFKGFIDTNTNVSHTTIEGRLINGNDLNIEQLCDNKNMTNNISEPITPVVLITRAESGDCTFSEKVKHLQEMMELNNTSVAAVIFYADKDEDPSVIQTVQGPDTNTAIIMVSWNIGMDLLDLSKQKNTTVIIEFKDRKFISFHPVICVMLAMFFAVSNAVLFYFLLYFLRGFFHELVSLCKKWRIKRAAKKVVPNLAMRTIKSGDEELESDFEACAICYEPYEVLDEIRTFPCRHVFHKSCVDPWLLEKGSCPMCFKDVVLRAYNEQQV